jgi:hypothetical protein
MSRPNFNPSNYNDWLQAPFLLRARDTEEFSYTPTFKIPPEYAPAKSFYAFSGNTYEMPLPWDSLVGQIAEAQQALLLTSGSLLGSLGAIALANQSQGIGTGIYKVGIGGKNGYGPIFGYCIGDKYCELNYSYITAARFASSVGGVAFSDNQLYQTAELKKIYIHHGEISGVELIPNEDGSGNTSEIKFNLGTTKNINPDDYDNISFNLKIIKSNGETIDFSINSIDQKFNFISNDVLNLNEASILPEVGDFYESDRAVCIEDPYLMTGFWIGTENENGLPKKALGFSNTSGLNLYQTSQNLGYIESKVVGVYVLKDKDSEVIRPSSNISMHDTGDNEWCWILTNENENIARLNSNAEVRFKINGVRTYRNISQFEEKDEEDEEEESEEEDLVVQRQNGTEDDINTHLSLFTDEEGNLTQKAFLRLELNNFGNTFSNNFYPPIGTRCFVRQEGNYFKILGQVDYNIVDVSMLDITGQNRLALGSSMEIINHYAWMIKQNLQDTTYAGYLSPFFKLRTINEATGSIFNVNVVESNAISRENFDQIPNTMREGVNGFNLNSFGERYSKDRVHESGEPIKLYKKREGWELYDPTQDRYWKIKDIDYSNRPEDPSGETEGVAYDVNISIEPQQIIIDGETIDAIPSNYAHVVFGREEYEHQSKIVPVNHNMTFKEQAKTGGNVLVTENPNYISSYLKGINIDSNDYFSLCDGLLHGLPNNYRSRWYANLYFTTPLSNRSIDAFQDKISRINWVVYADKDTNKISIRKGTLDFIDLPSKTEISIGPYSAIKGSENITLVNKNEDKKCERLKAVQVEMPSGLNKNVLFSINSEFDQNIGAEIEYNNVWGFKISGRGDTDLQVLRLAGITYEEQQNTLFLDNDEIVAPIFNRAVSPNRRAEATSLIPMGFNPLEVDRVYTSLDVTNVKQMYVYENQVLNNNRNFTLHKTRDGEVIMFYSEMVNYPIRKTVSNEEGDSGNNNINVQSENSDGLLNDPENDTKWIYNNNCVFCIGSFDDGFQWGTPCTKSLYDNFNENDRYNRPLMILNSATLLDSAYLENDDFFVLAYKCYDVDNNPFVGIHSFPKLALFKPLYFEEFEHKDFEEAEIQNYPLKFLWRPIPFNVNIDNDSTQYNFGPKVNLISRFETAQSNEFFIRMLGKEETKSQVVSSENDIFDYISVNLVVNSWIVFLYNDSKGVKGVTSFDLGFSCNKNDIILASNGTNGIVIENMLFYINSNGQITIKIFNASDWNLYFNAYELFLDGADSGNEEEDDEGEEDRNSEINKIQQQLDSLEEIIVDANPIDQQKISGYRSETGIYRIFYYDLGENLTCSESSDLYNWKISPNF